MQNRLLKIIALFLCFSLIFEQSGFTQVAGQLDISGYLTSLRSSFIQDKFRPLHLRYISYDNLNNSFNLLLDKGDFNKGLSPKGTDPKTKGTLPELKSATKELLKYFFVGITLPNDSFWVNLRPDSQDNIIDDYLAQTDVGKILLEADLQLKKDTAQFTSPQTPEGKNYWDKLYQKAGELLGADNITIPTLVRPWIVPDEIIIREAKDNAYIYKATLKVMLEDDYLKNSSTYNFKDPRLKVLNEYSSQLLKERIIPKLTKEINTSKRYAALRQAYYSLILAQWFKARFYGKGGLYSSLIDRRNLTGLISQGDWSKTQYFKEYQKSFKDGEYNLKEPIQTPYGQSVRSYFSGGMQLAVNLPQPGQTVIDPITSSPVTSISTKRPRDLNGIGDKYIAGITTGTGIEDLKVELETGQVGTGTERAQASRSASSPVEQDKGTALPVKGEGLGRRSFLKAAVVGAAAFSLGFRNSQQNVESGYDLKTRDAIIEALNKSVRSYYERIRKGEANDRALGDTLKSLIQETIQVADKSVSEFAPWQQGPNDNLLPFLTEALPAYFKKLNIVFKTSGIFVVINGRRTLVGAFVLAKINREFHKSITIRGMNIDYNVVIVGDRLIPDYFANAIGFTSAGWTEGNTIYLESVSLRKVREDIWGNWKRDYEDNAVRIQKGYLIQTQ